MLMGALKLLETRTRATSWWWSAPGCSCCSPPASTARRWCACRSTRCRRGSAARPSRSIATPARSARAPRCASPARALLIAAPLAVALFLFFPRLPGAFWALPRGGAALTGLSDEMTPGSISKLVADYDRPFACASRRAPRRRRALLARPGAARLRRLHLAAPRRRSFAPRQRLEYLGEPVRYRVTLEPTQPALLVRARHCPRAPPPRTCFSPTTTSCSRPTRSPGGQLRGGLLPAHARARAAHRRRPARGHRPAGRRAIRARSSWRRRCAQRAGSDAAYVQRGARLPAQRRLRVHARAAAARASIRSTTCCSTRARASAVTTPRPSSP